MTVTKGAGSAGRVQHWRCGGGLEGVVGFQC